MALASRTPFTSIARAAILAAALTAAPAFAQQEAAEDEAAAAAAAAAEAAAQAAAAEEPPGEIEAIVVIGSRRDPRSVLESAAPIDVLNQEALQERGGGDMDDLLRNLTPSYNVQRYEIDDEATLVRPASLRGLPSDASLVLVNGKRRHRSGVIATLGSSLNIGAQGPDLSVIPTIAIRQVELLRDGASAQYGSDAIAGVLNFQLNEADEGGRFEARRGKYSDGDGATWQMAGNVGLPILDTGFLNLSVEYSDTQPTIRSAQRSNATNLGGRGYPVADPVQIWGQPDVDNAISTFYNAGVDFEDAHGSGRVYSFGGYANRKSEGGFFFRAPGNPGARAGVFRTGSRRVVADLRRPNLPLDTDPNTAGIQNDCLDGLPSLDSSKADVDAYIQSKGQNCFLFNSRFPGGFTPRFGADIKDFSIVAGVRAENNSGFRYDFSVSTARSNVEFFMSNTINASLGPDTPTNFRPRDYIQSETAVNADFAYPLEVAAFHSPLNIAWGFEWRREQFETKAGDEASWLPGPYRLQGFSLGSNGFQGLNPNFAGKWERPNYALYADLEADVTDRLLLGVAVRHEDFYENFGATVKGKLSALFRVNDVLSVRGTASTGFRAPSPGQSNISLVTTAFDGSGNLAEEGQLPPTHPISRELGGRELEEEESTNFSAGAVFSFANDLTLTVDYFNIEIEDRISLTGGIPVTPEISAIISNRDEFAGALDIREVKFFTNDFSTTTQGVDVVLSYQRGWALGDTDVELAFNYTDSQLDAFSPARTINSFLGMPLQNPLTVSLLQPISEVELEELNPQNRVVWTTRHNFDAFSGMLRLSYFSAWKACNFQDSDCMTNDDPTPFSNLHDFDSQILADVELGYTLNEQYSLHVGVQNIFDKVPDAPISETTGQGNLHALSTPWDPNGAFWYARISADF